MRPRNRDPCELGPQAPVERAVVTDRSGNLAVLGPALPSSTHLTPEERESLRDCPHSQRAQRRDHSTCCPASRKELSGENHQGVCCLRVPKPQLPPNERLLTLKIHLLPFLLFLFPSLHRLPALEMRRTPKESRLQITSGSKGGSPPPGTDTLPAPAGPVPFALDDLPSLLPSLLRGPLCKQP